MRLGLVPEGGRGDVVLAGQVATFAFELAAPAEGLNGDAQPFVEPDRVHDVPAVHAEALNRFPPRLCCAGRVTTRRQLTNRVDWEQGVAS